MTCPWRTVLRGGKIVDGSGSPGVTADVVIESGRIASIDSSGAALLSGTQYGESTVVDCSGYVLAPGFIDAHSHSDLQVLSHRTEKLLQGVTAEVVGNCGFSAYPAGDDPQVLRDFANGILCGDNHWGWSSAAEYLASANDSRVAAVISLIGHGSLRIRVMGNTTREATGSELERMAALLEQALTEGAAGLSSGLMYAPGSGASSRELTALARVVARRGGVYATHMRSYSAGLVDAVHEQIAIAEASGCRLQISHLQAAGEDYWPLQQLAIDAIEKAATRGVDVAFDAYPWLAGSTVLTQVLPQSALEGGTSALLSRLRDPAQREVIRPYIKPEARWNGVVITSAASNEDQLVGRSVQQIANERGTTPEAAVMDILLEQEGNVNIVEHCQSLENLHALLAHPLAVVITDGVYTRGRSHPRLYGTFPLLLGDMVRERKWLSLEEAIRKVTSRPAEIFKIQERGRIANGYLADITVFDPEAVRTGATYEKPDVAPTGIRSVYRGGILAVNDGLIM